MSHASLLDRISDALARRDAHLVASLWQQLPGRLTRPRASAAPASTATQAPRWQGRDEEQLLLMRTCYHEAAHAVTAYHLGVQVTSLVARSDRQGWADYLLPDDVWARASMCWAGALGELPACRLRTITAREAETRLSASDREGIVAAVRTAESEYVRTFGADVHSPRSLAAFEQARHVLLTHRPALLALAAQLRHHGSLTGKQITAIINAH